MSLTRDEILKNDFPTARKGYDPAAVDAHLRDVADRVEKGAATASLAEVAAQKVAGIVEAAEAKAKEIEADASREADELLANARAQARDQIERAQRSVAKLVGQADELRERVGAMAREVGGGEESRAETEPQPVPEPAPPQPEIDPSPVTVPEPAPPLEPEPEPPSIPEPLPEPPAPAAANGADEQAARLVAMKMALDGSSREDVAKHLAANYELTNADQLLNAVFERAGR